MSGLTIALQPKQKLFKEKIEEIPILFYGGARGGGKSKGLRDIMLLRRFKYAGSHGAIFRKTYPELEGNHIRPIFDDFPELRKYWVDSKKLLTLPNGSTLQFCHCENEKDVELYQGREFHDLAIDEAGQWTEAAFRKLQGSNRSSKPGIKARTLLTGNPGGIGHAWLKRIFIERRFNERERPEDYGFIQALVDDNKALIQNDPAYVHRLNAEPNEALRKAWLYGDWDIFAGQYFTELRREVHFIRPFAIPPHWTTFGSYDFGFSHPAAFGWFACDEDGNVYLFREFIRAGLRVDQFATAILKFPETKRLDYTVAGWDCWTQKSVLKSGTPPTIAEEFFSHDIGLKRAAIDRILGANQLRNYLAHTNGKTKPKFFIFDTCPLSFDCLSRMQHDPDRLEDVLKVDATEGDEKTGDDPYDMIRYALMSRPQLAAVQRQAHARGTPEWLAVQEKEMDQRLEHSIQKQQADEMELDQLAIMEVDNELDAYKYFIHKREQHG